MDSPLSQPALLALPLLLLALYLARHALIGKRRNYPPVAGTVLHQLLNFGRLAEYHTELSHRYRTFRMLTPTCNYVYTVDPANVEYILRTNFANYGKGTMTHDVLEDLLGDGIFNVDGAKWRHQRKVASFEFSTRALREYSTGVFRDTAAKLADIVSAAAAEKAVDMQDLFMRSTLDSILKIGFGVNLGGLSRSSKEGSAFARAFDDASEQVLYRFFDMLWKTKRLLNVSSEAAMKRSVQTINPTSCTPLSTRRSSRWALPCCNISCFLESRAYQHGCSTKPDRRQSSIVTFPNFAGHERGHTVLDSCWRGRKTPTASTTSTFGTSY